MNNKPQQPSQATRLQLQLNLITPTHQISHQGDGGGAPPPPPFTFSIAKTKKGNKGKKSFKEKAIKRLSLRSKCYHPF